MGTWGKGPFDNDGAADFLSESAGSPQAIAQILRRCADASPDEYLDVDDGQPAIAACELVALGFGYGNLEKTPAKIRTLARALGPREDLRLLAIRALGPIRDSKRSEIAGLWGDDSAFDASMVNLLERLTEAGD